MNQEIFCEVCGQAPATTGASEVSLCQNCFDAIANRDDPKRFAKFSNLVQSRAETAQREAMEQLLRTEASADFQTSPDGPWTIPGRATKTNAERQLESWTRDQLVRLLAIPVKCPACDSTLGDSTICPTCGAGISQRWSVKDRLVGFLAGLAAAVICAALFLLFATGINTVFSDSFIGRFAPILIWPLGIGTFVALAISLYYAVGRTPRHEQLRILGRRYRESKYQNLSQAVRCYAEAVVMDQPTPEDFKFWSESVARQPVSDVELLGTLRDLMFVTLVRRHYLWNADLGIMDSDKTMLSSLANDGAAMHAVFRSIIAILEAGPATPPSVSGFRRSLAKLARGSAPRLAQSIEGMMWG